MPSEMEVPPATKQRFLERHHAQPGSRARLRRTAAAADREAFLVLVLATAAIVQASFARLAIGTDSWYALVGGRFVLHSWLPRRDTLAVLTRGRDWVDQQWLAHLVLYGLWSGGGWPLALVVLVAVSVSAYGISACTSRLLGASPRSAALVLLACFLVGFADTSYRAQTLAYPLFALIALLVLVDERRPSRRVWLVFPLLVLWANLHGSVLLGVGLVALRGATLLVGALGGRRSPRRGALAKGAALTLLPWLCALASPYALSLPGYYRRVLDNPTLSHLVSQWQPATIRNAPLFFVLLLCGLWLVFRYRSTLSPFAQLAFVAFGVVGLSAVRNIVWFSLFAAAVLPPALEAAWPSRPAERRPIVNLVLVAAGLAGIVATAATLASHSRSWYERDYPRAAADVLARAVAAKPTSRVFADVRYADWLLLEHPALAGRVAYDVRYELLTARELRRLDDFSNQRGTAWARIARGYRLLVLDARRERDVIRYLVTQKQATPLYRNGEVVVLELDRAAT